MMSNTSAALVSDQERRIGFFYLVFREDIEFDNVFLSGDPNKIEKKKLGNKYAMDGIETAAMFVYSMIAICNGGHRVKQKEKTSALLSFD
jgi:hypothetical protein